MRKHKCLVTIANEGNIVRGNLRELRSNGKQTDFDPLTVLGDLLNAVTYTATSSHPQDNYSLKEGYSQHPFFLGRKYRGDTNLGDYRHRPLFVAVNELNEVISNNIHFSMSEFEILKQFLSLNFVYQIEFREANPFFELGYAINPGNNKAVQEYQYVPVQYTYNYDMELMFGDNSDTPHRFTYNCFEIKDVIFSVLHYLTLLDYKFRKCEHCGNYFATKTLKTIYCNRNSPYTGYEHLPCGEAVDHIMTSLMKRRHSIKTYLYNNYSDRASDFLYEFSEQKRLGRSVSNLEMLEHITSKEYVKQKWYKQGN